MGVLGGLFKDTVALVSDADMSLFDARIRDHLGARPGADVLVHRIQFASAKFDMTEVAAALRVSHIMFDGLRPAHVSLNTRDREGDGNEEHGAVIERGRHATSTIWLNGLALHNVFSDDRYARPGEHPNLRMR